jgi:hypothetical protein
LVNILPDRARSRAHCSHPAALRTTLIRVSYRLLSTIAALILSSSGAGGLCYPASFPFKDAPLNQDDPDDPLATPARSSSLCAAKAFYQSVSTDNDILAEGIVFIDTASASPEPITVKGM